MFSVPTPSVVANLATQPLAEESDPSSKILKNIAERIQYLKALMLSVKNGPQFRNYDPAHIIDISLRAGILGEVLGIQALMDQVLNSKRVIETLTLNFGNQDSAYYATNKNILKKLRELPLRGNGTMQGFILMKEKTNDKLRMVNFLVDNNEHGNRIYFLHTGTDSLFMAACMEAKSFKKYMAQFKDNMMYTPSVYGVERQNIVACAEWELLLRQKNINSQNIDQINKGFAENESSLFIAIGSNNLGNVGRIISRSPWTLQQVSDGNTAFSLAAKLGYLEIMGLMYKQEPRVIEQTGLGAKSALLVAMRHKQIKAAIFILEHHPIFLEPNHEKLDIFIRKFWITMTKNLNAYHQEAMINAFNKAADCSPFAECIHRQFDYLIRPSNYDKKTSFSSGVDFTRSYELLMRNNQKVFDNTQHYSHSMNTRSCTYSENASTLLWSVGAQFLKDRRKRFFQSEELSSAYPSSSDEEIECPLQEPVMAPIYTNLLPLRRMNRMKSANNQSNHHRGSNSSVYQNSSEDIQMSLVSGNVSKRKRNGS